jgi:23S rRNA (pseudouridine1915-N3)-methyltransferase
MRVQVLAVGRMKNPAFRAACDDYATRIRRYQQLDLHEIREAGRPDRAAAEAKRVEGDALLRAISPRQRIFTLTRKGSELSSDELASALQRWREDARDVALVVGGAHGVAESVIERSEGTISLSPMTLPHDIARLVLLEQLYRACTILRGERYHKGEHRD